MDVGPQHEVVHNQKQDVEMINVAQQSQETTTEYQAWTNTEYKTLIIQSYKKTNQTTPQQAPMTQF